MLVKNCECLGLLINNRDYYGVYLIMCYIC